MEIKIKRAVPSNLRDIQNLNHQLCIKENKEFDPTINKDYAIQKFGEKYFKERIRKGCALVAVVDSKVVGYLLGGIARPEGYRNVAKLAEAENMFVISEFRSKGVGKQLLRRFSKWCKSKKAKRLRVVVSAQNTKATEFYEREGFSDYTRTLEKELK